MKKRTWVVSLVLIMLVILSVAGWKVMDNWKDRQLEKQIAEQITKQLALGEKYLLEMNYEQAIVAFSKVIELDQRNISSYSKLAQAYLAVGDLEQAVEILRKGVDQTQDAALVKQLEDYQYIKDSQGMINNLIHVFQSGNRDAAWKVQGEDAYQELITRLDEVMVQQLEDGTYLLIYPCGHCYYGQLEGGLRSGHGIFSSYDYLEGQMEYYEGAWASDYPNGQGDYWTVCLPVPWDLFYYSGNWKDGREDGTVFYQYINSYGEEIHEESYSYQAEYGIRAEVTDQHPDRAPDSGEREKYCYFSNEEYSKYTTKGYITGISHARKEFDDEETGMSGR